MFEACHKRSHRFVWPLRCNPSKQHSNESIRWTELVHPPLSVRGGGSYYYGMPSTAVATHLGVQGMRSAKVWGLILLRHVMRKHEMPKVLSQLRKARLVGKEKPKRRTKTNAGKNQGKGAKIGEGAPKSGDWHKGKARSNGW